MARPHGQQPGCSVGVAPNASSQYGLVTIRNLILNLLVSTGTLLNAVVNASCRCGDGTGALGMDAAHTGYVADGSGGFTTCAGASAISGSGGTISQYVDLAIGSGGAAWDLNQLRAGGLTADSFTDAFIAIKVGEIQQQQPTSVPDPASLLLLGLGLAGMAAARRLQG